MKEKERQILEQTLKNIEEGERLIREKDIKKNIVIVIGNTGVGKGTLINYINGVKLKAEKNKDGKITLKPSEGASILPNITISDSTTTSDTFYPGVHTSQTKDNNNEEYSYIDCPGFGDTRGSEHDIANAYFRNAVTRNINKLKIVVVISYNDLVGSEGRGQSLFKVIKDLSRFLGFTESPENMEKIKDSISLIITRVENNNSEIQELKKQIGDKTLKLEKFKTLSPIKLADEIAGLNREISDLNQKLKSLEGEDSPKEIIKRKLLEFIAKDRGEGNSKGNEQKFTPSERGLIDYLANNVRFEIFSQPKEEVANIGTNEKDAILDLIGTRTKYTAKSEIKICITVSDESRLKGGELANKIGEDIKSQVEELKNKLIIESNKKIENFCSPEELENFLSAVRRNLAEVTDENIQDNKDFLAKIANFSQINIKEVENNNSEIQELKKQIGDKTSKLEEFQKSKSLELADEIAGLNREISDLNQKLKSLEIYDNIKKNLNYLDFLKEIKSSFADKISDWKEGLRDISEKLNKLTKIEENISNNILTLQGQIINTSQAIKKIIENSKEDIQVINIYSLNKFIFDEDLKTAKLKGMNLNIIAPRWKIIGNKTIDISGIEGIPHTELKVLKKHNTPRGAKEDGSGIDGIRGASGAPGNPGGNGGNFFGIGQKFEGIDKLVINVSGGRGGSGQIGGDGSNGSNSTVDGNKEGVASKSIEGLGFTFSKTKNSIFQLTTKNIYPLRIEDKLLKYYRSEGLKGGKGGDAGAGGAGGMGGYVGRVELLGEMTVAELKIINKREKGNDGDAGQPGTSGKNGRIYHGIYVDAHEFGMQVAGKLGAKIFSGAVEGGEIIGKGIGIATGSVIGAATGLATGGIIIAGAVAVGAAITVTTFGTLAAGAIAGGGVAGKVAIKAGASIGKNIFKAVQVIGMGLGIGLGGLLGGVVGFSAIVGKIAINAINHGWQGIEEELSSKMPGQQPEDKNSKGIIEPNKLNEIDKTQIFKCYMDYVKIQESNPFVVNLNLNAAFSTSITNDEIRKECNSNTQSGQVYNAFNQRHNSNYSYQDKDMIFIQKQIIKQFNKLNTPIDFIFNKDNKYWSTMAQLQNNNEKIILYKNPYLRNSNDQHKNTTMIINNLDQDIIEADSGIAALENMRIITRELQKNKKEFIKTFGSYEKFCQANKIMSLREEFAKKYVYAVCDMVKYDSIEKQILSLVIKVYEHKIKAIEKILSIQEGSTIELKLVNFHYKEGNYEHCYKISYEYCYKISWLKNFNPQKIDFQKLQESFGNTILYIREAINQNWLHIIPETNIAKLKSESVSFKPTLDLKSLSQILLGEFCNDNEQHTLENIINAYNNDASLLGEYSLN